MWGMRGSFSSLVWRTKLVDTDLKLKRRDFTSIASPQKSQRPTVAGSCQVRMGVGIRGLKQNKTRRMSLRCSFQNALPGQWICFSLDLTLDKECKKACNFLIFSSNKLVFSHWYLRCLSDSSVPGATFFWHLFSGFVVRLDFLWRQPMGASI